MDPYEGQEVMVQAILAFLQKHLGKETSGAYWAHVGFPWVSHSTLLCPDMTRTQENGRLAGRVVSAAAQKTPLLKVCPSRP